MVDKIKINDYSVIFQTNDNTYEIDIYNLINYIQDYFCPDDIIVDYNGLCDLIESLACSYDLTEIIRLCKRLDDDIINKDFIVIDLYNYGILSFNTIKELTDIYDISDIIVDIIDNDDLKEYCDYYDGK